MIMDGDHQYNFDKWLNVAEVSINYANNVIWIAIKYLLQSTVSMCSNLLHAQKFSLLLSMCSNLPYTVLHVLY